MAISYTPDTNDSPRFFTEGDGNFEIIAYDERPSKSSGNMMGVLSITIWDCKGKRGQNDDYFIPNKEYTAIRVKTLLIAIGREEDNLLGKFDGSKYIGLCGPLKIKYQVDKNDPEGRERVRWHYLAPKKKEEAQIGIPATPVFADDDIQF